MSAQVTDDIKLSLKVYTAAHYFAMQELTGGVDSEYSIRVLNDQNRYRERTLEGVAIIAVLVIGCCRHEANERVRASPQVWTLDE